MPAADPVGYLASLLVLTAFCMRGIVSLRVAAIASNLAFIVYAALSGIEPVLLLHALLLPVNVYRLVQALRLERRAMPEASSPRQHFALESGQEQGGPP
jgi:CRP/FNR family transcriptional regulator, cyclic AMP receptor protein